MTLTAAQSELLLSMGYNGPDNRCQRCRHFMPDDCSGDMRAKSAHCALNPAIDLPVDPQGWCKHFKART